MNEHGYEIKSGVIVSPGKFEGEPEYAPHFYEIMCGGGADATIYDGDVQIDVFVVTTDDVARFPELAGVYAVLLWERSDGFVETDECTRSQLGRLMSEKEQVSDIHLRW